MNRLRFFICFAMDNNYHGVVLQKRKGGSKPDDILRTERKRLQGCLHPIQMAVLLQLIHLYPHVLRFR